MNHIINQPGYVLAARQRQGMVRRARERMEEVASRLERDKNDLKTTPKILRPEILESIRRCEREYAQLQYLLGERRSY